MTEKLYLQVFIRNRSKTLFKDSSQSVTSYNNNGIFDILPLHANFITLIEKEIIIDRGMKSETHINVNKGLLCVLNDKVDIYLDI